MHPADEMSSSAMCLANEVSSTAMCAADEVLHTVLSTQTKGHRMRYYTQCSASRHTGLLTEVAEACTRPPAPPGAILHLKALPCASRCFPQKH